MPEKILIVDDDVETVRLVTIMLQRQGYIISVASNGAQGISMARTEIPDLIVLDVMMPDMDGFQVTRLLRQYTETASILILMFTAKTQVDDKVAGYNAGVDDYLTKPIHPAELVAHIKSLLARGKTRTSAPPPSAKRGYTIGVIAPKGGLGASSLTFNLALSYYQKYKTEIICAELRPGHGAWGLDMGYTLTTGLATLLRMKPGEINPNIIENELTRTTFGMRLLLASADPREVELVANGPAMEALIQQISYMAPLSFFDIGVSILPNFERVLHQMDEAILITEPFPGTVQRTKQYFDLLSTFSFGKSKALTLVLINRVRADIQLSATQVQDIVGLPVSQVIPPAPELAFQAAQRSLPLIRVQPDGLIANQFARLAEMIGQRVEQT